METLEHVIGDRPGSENDTCFVVMPFGKKPKNDGTNNTYDFDKIYRVIIQRAIRGADMEPLRADETEGSRVIHADMFKDLRDRPVVLVDLSLLNPNVLYELGIRHVMSSKGTILIANEETIRRLPFDIALSRTIPYKFDGEFLDFEEVERVVPLVRDAIQEAKVGKPDSPVYAFLEQVLSSGSGNNDKEKKDFSVYNTYSFSDLNNYQIKLAETWRYQRNDKLDKRIDDQEIFENLTREHRNSTFGIRAIGYYYDSQLNDYEKSILSRVAEIMFNHEQYDLAVKLYEKIEEDELEQIVKSELEKVEKEELEKIGVDELERILRDELKFRHMVSYGSAVSHVDPNEDGANNGLNILKRARDFAKEMIDAKLKSEEWQKSWQKNYSYATQKVAGMLEWKWCIMRRDEDLKEAIKEVKHSIELIEALREKGNTDIPSGRYAHNLLRHAMLLRIADDDPDRWDGEKNFEKILGLKPYNNQKNQESDSYLRWYQVLVLADRGNFDDAQARAYRAISSDTQLINQLENTPIGRQQYSELRRMVENYSRYWRDQKSIVRISQILNHQLL